MKTKTMPAGIFRRKCLAIIDEVHAKGESIIITKHGKPIAKLVPIPPNRDVFYDFIRARLRFSAISSVRFFPKKSGKQTSCFP
jgi:prevent-host-death family protein